MRMYYGHVNGIVVFVFQIMKNNYEQMVKAHQAQPSTKETHVPSEVKFQAFKTLMDELFKVIILK